MKLILFCFVFITICIGCVTSQTHNEICNSFVGKDYYDVQEDLGELIWLDFRGDDMVRAYKKKNCTTFLHIDRKNIVTYWETKGECKQ